MDYKVIIDEDKLNEVIVNEVVRQAVANLKSSLFGDERYYFLHRAYKENVQAEVRKMLKDHEKEILDRAVQEASVRIAKKGLSQLLEQQLEEKDG